MVSTSIPLVYSLAPPHRPDGETVSVPDNMMYLVDAMSLLCEASSNDIT